MTAFSYIKNLRRAEHLAGKVLIRIGGVYNDLFTDGCPGVHADRARYEQPARASRRFASTGAQTFPFMPKLDDVPLSATAGPTGRREKEWERVACLVRQSHRQARIITTSIGKSIISYGW